MDNKMCSAEGFCLNVHYSDWSTSCHSCHHLWPLIQNYALLIFKSRDDWLKGLDKDDEAFSPLTKDSCSHVVLFWHLDFLFLFLMVCFLGVFLVYIVLSCHSVTHLYALHRSTQWGRQHEERGDMRGDVRRTRMKGCEKGDDKRAAG